MGLKLYTEEYIANIADAIRTANGSSDTYKVSEMAGAVAELSALPEIDNVSFPVVT